MRAALKDGVAVGDVVFIAAGIFDQKHQFPVVPADIAQMFAGYFALGGNLAGNDFEFARADRMYGGNVVSAQPADDRVDHDIAHGYGDVHAELIGDFIERGIGRERNHPSDTSQFKICGGHQIAFIIA